MVFNTDNATSVLGSVAGLSAIASQFGIFPIYSTALGAISVALLGLFSNKKNIGS